MDITKYIEEYALKKRFPNLSCKPEVVRNLLVGKDGSAPEFALVSQEGYGESESLGYNIELSVLKYERNKGTAIEIYKDFLAFLSKKGVVVDVDFPPVDPSNSFERLMFIAKYLQDPKNKKENLYSPNNADDGPGGILWVSERTVRDDLKRLRGEDDPIQVCGRAFKYDDVEYVEDATYKRSTAHPLFLTQNLTQVLVMLKGLRGMAQNQFYKDWAILTVAEIWEQLSDYAKERINFVLQESAPDDLEWYKGLPIPNENSFHSEFEFEKGNAVIVNCLKNKQPCYIEYQGDDGVCIFKQCKMVRESYFADFTGTKTIEFDTDQGRVSLDVNKILRAAYELEGLA